MTSGTAEISPLVYARVAGLRTQKSDKTNSRYVTWKGRLNYERCEDEYEDKAFSIMGSCNVMVNIWGKFFIL